MQKKFWVRGTRKKSFAQGGKKARGGKKGAKLPAGGVAKCQAYKTSKIVFPREKKKTSSWTVISWTDSRGQTNLSMPPEIVGGKTHFRGEKFNL